MKRLLSLLAGLLLVSCLFSSDQAIAGRVKSNVKVCAFGVTVRSNQKCPTLTVPRFSVVDVSVSEAAGTVTVHITKSGGNGQSSSLTYATANLTALSVTDYTAVSGSITFLSSETDKIVTVSITDDSTSESNETLAFNITASSNAVVSRSGIVTILNDDAVPTSPGLLTGETTIADNFDLTPWLEAGESPHVSPDQTGAFRFTCLSGHLSHNDPIVYPGQTGASHLHQFFGNTGTNASSTYSSLRTTGGSTCTRSLTESPQRTAYWMPAMLDGAGNAVKPDWINTYYKQLPASDPDCAITLDPTVVGHCIPLPNGIRYVFGYNMTTHTGGPTDTNGRDYWAMGFICISKVSGEPDYTGVKHSIAEIVATGLCPAGAWLEVFLGFPQCWDGVHLDSVDHRSHIIMPPQSICPGTHPYKVPEVTVKAFYTTDANFLAGNWLFSSDKVMNDMGMPVVAGTTLHMDYFEAWSAVIKNLWQTNCIDGHQSCSTGNVGDSREVVGMQQVGPFPDHVLVPLNTIP